MSDTYPKIENVWKRDPDRRDRLREGHWTDPVFRYLAPADWDWTEKIDGTNIRVELEYPLTSDAAPRVRFDGRTDRALLPGRLVQRLQELFPLDKMLGTFSHDVTLYGEGYGAGIQRGGGYLPDRQDFILFDVRVGDYWLERDNVQAIANTLGVQTVPLVKRGPLTEAIEFVRAGFLSLVAETPTPAEGLIVRPSLELAKRNGERIIAKIKTRDFPGTP